MNFDKLLKDYEALVEDLEEVGYSLGEIKHILKIKESVKNTTSTYKYRYQVPIECKYEWEDMVLNSTESGLSSFYNELGFDKNYKVVLDFCRIEGEYTWCLVGSERFDNVWIESGNATDELVDVIKDINNPMRRQAGQSMNDRSRLKLGK